MIIEKWIEEDLLQLPKEENEGIEYKSSKTPIEKLKEKMCIAASAFWNSGGGIFIAGVNDSGEIDGGFPESIGRQKIRDWVDQILSGVEPLGNYEINLITKALPNSKINDNHVVLVIAFLQSEIGPHMSNDKKYYVRAGAHSGPSGHFLVEAIRAKRGFQKPMLRGVLKMHEHKADIVQLVILALTNTTAINTTLTFEPLPDVFAKHFKDKFPLFIPAIDQKNSFTMDISMFPGGHQVFGKNPVTMILEYEDILGRKFVEHQELDPSKNMGPLGIGKYDTYKLNKTLEKLIDNVGNLVKVIDKG
jgi:hypothetical protein